MEAANKLQYHDHYGLQRNMPLQIQMCTNIEGQEVRPARGTALPFICISEAFLHIYPVHMRKG